MVYIVGKPTLDAYLLLLLLHNKAVFPVAVGKSLLQPRIQAHNVARYDSKLVVGKSGSIVHTFSALSSFSKFAQSGNILTHAPGREKPYKAHCHGYAGYNP